MSFGEIIKEIPKLTALERQSLMLELQRQQQLEASREFASLFEGVTEIDLQDNRENTELADALQRHLKEIKTA